MAIVESLLMATLLIAASQSVRTNDTSAAGKKDFYLLPREVVPIHYDIRLVPHLVEGNFTFDGETSIDVEVLEPTDAIVLHIKNLTIDEWETKLTRSRIITDVNEIVPFHVLDRHEYNEKAETLTLRFDEPVHTGRYNLYFKFVGAILSTGYGFSRSSYTDNNGDNVWLAVTHFHPVTARQAFPCWDEPAVKATFKFSIKHYPKYTALSNMPSSRSKIDRADGKVWTRFRTTPVMSTSVLGFVVAEYDNVSIMNGTMRVWGPKRLLQLATYSLDVAKKAKREMEKFTNSTLPVPKLDHVVTPHYPSRATENWGMVIYEENVLLYNESVITEDEVYSNVRPVEIKVMNVLTIVHEVVHQWFGDLVTPAWWSYLWLSEGISTYLEYFITDKFLKEWRLMDLFVEQHVLTTFERDIDEWTKPVHINITWNAYAAYSNNTYNKSAVLLRMLSHVLRKDVFRNGLMKYLRAHAHGSTRPNDLWKALQEALDESNVPHGDFKVKKVMDTWFNQARYPVVTIDRNYTNGEIKVTQKVAGCDMLDAEKSDAAWWIPLNFATQSNLDFSSTLATHWLRPQDEAVTISGVKANDWIIVNKQLTGYYRVNYDVTNWERIAEFLNSDDYAKIPVLNRLQIIGDAFFMVKTGLLDPITFLKIMNYLSRETDYIVWQTAIRIIEDLDIYLRVPEGAAIFRPYVFRLMRKILRKVGFEDRPSEIHLATTTRSSLASYACAYKHSRCPAKAYAKLVAYVENPIKSNVSRNQQWIFCFGLMKAKGAIWNRFLQAQNMTLEYHLQYLGCSENMGIIEKHINYITTMEDRELSKDWYYYRLFRNVFKNPFNVDKAINFFMNNSDKFANILSEDCVLGLMIQECINEEQIERIRVFTEKHGIYANETLNEKIQELIRVRENSGKIRKTLKND